MPIAALLRDDGSRYYTTLTEAAKGKLVVVHFFDYNADKVFSTQWTCEYGPTPRDDFSPEIGQKILVPQELKVHMVLIKSHRRANEGFNV